MQAFIKKFTKWCTKLRNRFMNYNNSKKRFLIYLIILTVVLLFFSLVKISADINWDGWETFSLVSKSYFRSLIIVWLSLAFLILRNMSIWFKKLMSQALSLREDEPLIDFMLLWVITSIFMWIVDTVQIAQILSPRIWVTGWAVLAQLMLLWGLIWSFITLWMNAKKNEKKAKILHMPNEDFEKKQPEIVNRPRNVRHLFDEIEEDRP